MANTVLCYMCGKSADEAPPCQRRPGLMQCFGVAWVQRIHNAIMTSEGGSVTMDPILTDRALRDSLKRCESSSQEGGRRFFHPGCLQRDGAVLHNRQLTTKTKSGRIRVKSQWHQCCDECLVRGGQDPQSHKIQSEQKFLEQRREQKRMCNAKKRTQERLSRVCERFGLDVVMRYCANQLQGTGVVVQPFMAVTPLPSTHNLSEGSQLSGHTSSEGLVRLGQGDSQAGSLSILPGQGLPVVPVSSIPKLPVSGTVLIPMGAPEILVPGPPGASLSAAHLPDSTIAAASTADADASISFATSSHAVSPTPVHEVLKSSGLLDPNMMPSTPAGQPNVSCSSFVNSEPLPSVDISLMSASVQPVHKPVGADYVILAGGRCMSGDETTGELCHSFPRGQKDSPSLMKWAEGTIGSAAGTFMNPHSSLTLALNSSPFSTSGALPLLFPETDTQAYTVFPSSASKHGAGSLMLAAPSGILQSSEGAYASHATPTPPLKQSGASSEPECTVMTNMVEVLEPVVSTSSPNRGSDPGGCALTSPMPVDRQIQWGSTQSAPDCRSGCTPVVISPCRVSGHLQRFPLDPAVPMPWYYPSGVVDGVPATNHVQPPRPTAVGLSIQPASHAVAAPQQPLGREETSTLGARPRQDSGSSSLEELSLLERRRGQSQCLVLSAPALEKSNNTMHDWDEGTPDIDD